MWFIQLSDSIYSKMAIYFKYVGDETKQKLREYTSSGSTGVPSLALPEWRKSEKNQQEDQQQVSKNRVLGP